jgi:hypothetical protein
VPGKAFCVRCGERLVAPIPEQSHIPQHGTAHYAVGTGTPTEDLASTSESASSGRVSGSSAPSASPALLAPPNSPVIPAGWFPDPHGVAAHRWWDGLAWTSHTTPFPTPVQAMMPTAEQVPEGDSASAPARRRGQRHTDTPWADEAKKILTIALGIEALNCGLDLFDVGRGPSVAETVWSASFGFAVIALFFWRIWRRGRITYLVLTPSLLVIGAWGYVDSQNHYRDNGFTRPLPSIVLALGLLTFVLGVLACYLPPVRHHVLDGRRLFRRDARLEPKAGPSPTSAGSPADLLPSATATASTPAGGSVFPGPEQRKWRLQTSKKEIGGVALFVVAVLGRLGFRHLFH